MKIPSLERFLETGFLGPLRILSEDDCRRFDEAATTAGRRRPPADWAKGCGASSHVFYGIATHPAIMAVVSELLGENVMLWGAGMPVRAPGGAHCWHSDIESAATDAPTVSVWIGIHNTSVASSLQLVPYSHRFGITLQEERHRRAIARTEVRTEDVVEWARQRDDRCYLLMPDMTDGQAIFFHGHLWHHSVNTSPRTRRALLLQYAAPEAVIRIPDRKRLDWPFRQLTAPRPACVMVRGRDTGGVNRIVDPPRPSGEEFAQPLTDRIAPFRLPLAPDPGSGWRPYPLFAGRTAMVDRLSCHVSALAGGHCPHPPHRHGEEELLVLLAGEVALTLPDLPPEECSDVLRLERGDFVYYPAGFSHTLTTTGPRPANYLMFKWSGDSQPHQPRLGFQKFNAFDFVESLTQARGFRPRRVFQQATDNLALLNCHVSTLAPGAGYDPHRDAYDVAIVLLQGDIEASGERISDHGVMFFPAGEPHGLYNPGDAAAVYLVLEFHGRGGGPVPAGCEVSAGDTRPAPAPVVSRGAAAGADTTSRPIFVIGCGRSGTTLVQRIVNAASGTAVFGEHNGFLRPLAEAYFAQQAKGCAASKSTGADFENEIRQKLKDPRAWPGWVNPYREADLARHYAAFIAGWFNPAWMAAERWGFKEIRYGGPDRVVDMLLEIFQNCRIVFVARNPVDTIASQRLCAFGELDSLLEGWVSSNHAYLGHAAAHPERCRIVCYESVVASCRGSVSGLYDWLELPDPPAGAAVVDLPEGRYAMRAGGRLPRELLSSEQLDRIFVEAHDLAGRLGLDLPVSPVRAEEVAFSLSRNGARIGPFSNGRVIRCDPVVLALWTRCDGRRVLNDIESEMAEVASVPDVHRALNELIELDAVSFRPAGP